MAMGLPLQFSWRRILLRFLVKVSGKLLPQPETNPAPLSSLAVDSVPRPSKQSKEHIQRISGEVALQSLRDTLEQGSALQAAHPFSVPLGFSSLSLYLPSFLDFHSICIFLFSPSSLSPEDIFICIYKVIEELNIHSLSLLSELEAQ